MIFSKCVPTHNKAALASHFNMTSKSILGRYLGVLFNASTITNNTFKNLMLKTEQKLNLWSSNLESKAGKVVLIQSHLEGLPSYVMTISNIPMSVSNNLDQLYRIFFGNSLRIKKAYL